MLMTPRFLNFLPLLGVLLLAACGSASRTDALLNDVESYINDAPDSARTALQALDTTALRTRRLRARYALLRTRAQAKCFIDFRNRFQRITIRILIKVKRICIYGET